MFRVPSRPTCSGAAAPPRLAYGSRRRLVGVMYGRNGWQPNGRPTSGTLAVADGPAVRAPWGELEHQIPSVTISTQLFPFEWWTAPGLRSTVGARATAAPTELVTRPTIIPILPEPLEEVPAASEPVGAALTAAEPAERQAERDAPERDAPEGDAPEREARRARSAARRSARQRRGLATRVALVAIGLILSLIAVESATRRRP